MSDPKFTECRRFDLSFGQVLHNIFEAFRRRAQDSTDNFLLWAIYWTIIMLNNFGVLFWRGIFLASKILSHEHLIALLNAPCHPVHPGPKLLHNLAMLIPSKRLTQLLDKVLPFHSEIVKAVNTLVKLAAS
jgi:hypothetical protein